MCSVFTPQLQEKPAKDNTNDFYPLCQQAEYIHRADVVNSWKVKSIQFDDTYPNLFYTYMNLKNNKFEEKG